MACHTHHALPFPGHTHLCSVLQLDISQLYLERGPGQPVALNSGTFHLVKHLHGHACQGVIHAVMAS